MFELYSIRNRDKSLDPDIYEYDTFPESFRNQYCKIISDIIPIATANMRSFDNYDVTDIYSKICSGYAREKGLKNISLYEKYVDTCSDIDFLDLMDYSLHFLNIMVSIGCRNQHSYIQQFQNSYNRYINELNYRFKQHNLGYEFCNGEIIRIDNQVTHQEIVKPALQLLTNPTFQGANEEYLLAWKHYKQGRYKDCILNAGKAFESTMKIICENLHYPYNKEKDTAGKLLGILKENQFYPSYLEDYMNGVFTTLKSGAPTIRNKTSGHGQGVNTEPIPQSLALYELNMVATNIVFFYSLYESHKVQEVTP